VLSLLPSISPAVGSTNDSSDGAESSVCDAMSNAGAENILAAVATTQFAEQINRARDGLVSASRHAVPLPPLPHAVKMNSEVDDVWNRISVRVSKRHQLRIRDLDFSDLLSADDSASTQPPSPGTVSESAIPTPPPPPPTFIIPPAPPLGDSVARPPPALSLSSPAAAKTRKTMKLHWKEAKPDVRSVFSSEALETIWTQMSHEIGPVKIDCNKLEHLFETRTVDMKSKVLGLVMWTLHEQ